MMEKDEGAGQNVRFDAQGWGWGGKCGDRAMVQNPFTARQEMSACREETQHYYL